MLSINHVFTRAGITMTVGNIHLVTLKLTLAVQDFSQDILNYQEETQNAEL